MGAEVVLAPLGVVHMWLQCFLVFRILPQRKSEAKPSKMHIDYVKDAAVDTWSTSSDTEDE